MCSPLPPVIGLPAARSPAVVEARSSRPTPSSSGTAFTNAPQTPPAASTRARTSSGWPFVSRVDRNDTPSGAIVEELGAPADASGAPAAVEPLYRDDVNFVLQAVDKLAEAKGLVRRAACQRLREVSQRAVAHAPCVATPQRRRSIDFQIAFAVELDALGDPPLRSAEPGHLERFGSRGVGRGIHRGRARHDRHTVQCGEVQARRVQRCAAALMIVPGTSKGALPGPADAVKVAASDMASWGASLGRGALCIFRHGNDLSARTGALLVIRPFGCELI